MPISTTIRYAGLRYLDRTAALENGEIVAPGAAIELRFTASPEEALGLLRSGAADCAEVPLATIFEPDFDVEYVALPVFPNRSFTSQNLVGAHALPSSEALAGLRIGLPAEDATSSAWARSLVTALLGDRAETVTWTSIPVVELTASVANGDSDVVVLPPGTEQPGLVSVLPIGADREAYAHIGDPFIPILSVVVLSRAVYAGKRWLAETLVDAFAEAKEEGMKRHRYFGALSVGLPWLMSELEQLDDRFGGDAYPYGIGSNRAGLERFAEFVGAGADVVAPFAPESRLLPGVPDVTFYAVPLSRVK
jgi:4,5-dihydroxyphthalate decarboxylase